MPPGLAEALLEEPEATARTKSGPVPDRDDVCGFPVALSVIVRLPLRAPSAVGVKVTEIVQLFPAARPDPQLLLWAKSPSAVMVEIVKGMDPVFDRVMAFAELVVPMLWPSKVKLEGERVIVGASPVPFNATTCGLDARLSVRDSVPVMLPPMTGANETCTVQWPPLMMGDEQSLVWLKFVLAEMPENFRGAIPILEIVTSCRVLVCPEANVANLSEEWSIEIWGALNKPLK